MTKLLLVTFIVFGSVTVWADAYNECVARVLQSYPQPLKNKDRKEALVTITSNCKDKKQSVDKLESQCQGYMFRVKRDEGVNAIASGFKRCRELAEKMEPPQSGINCGIKICQKNGQEEKCVDRAEGFFTSSNDEHCSKWLPYSRCVLDALQFNSQEAVYVYWNRGEQSGKVSCSDL